jgi:hypothetical protein
VTPETIINMLTAMAAGWRVRFAGREYTVVGCKNGGRVLCLNDGTMQHSLDVPAADVQPQQPRK